VAFDMDPGFTVSQIAGRSTSSENCFPQRIDLQEIVDEFTSRSLGSN